MPPKTEPHFGQSEDTPAHLRRNYAPEVPPAPPGATDGGNGGGWTPQVFDSLLGRVERLVKEGFMMYQQAKGKNGAHADGLETAYTKTAPAAVDEGPPLPEVTGIPAGETKAPAAPPAGECHCEIKGTAKEVAKRIYDGVLDMFGEIPNPKMVAVEYVSDMMIQEEPKVLEGIEKWLTTK